MKLFIVVISILFCLIYGQQDRKIVRCNDETLNYYYEPDIPIGLGYNLYKAEIVHNKRIFAVPRTENCITSIYENITKYKLPIPNSSFATTEHIDEHYQDRRSINNQLDYQKFVLDKVSISDGLGQKLLGYDTRDSSANLYNVHQWFERGLNFAYEKKYHNILKISWVNETVNFGEDFLGRLRSIKADLSIAEFLVERIIEDYGGFFVAGAK
uniref:Uncharacterized protein n=1 Tax=Acrobeloides nanus TaxID=290746 RepID=A0A914CQ95_9BILA